SRRRSPQPEPPYRPGGRWPERHRSGGRGPAGRAWGPHSPRKAPVCRGRGGKFTRMIEVLIGAAALAGLTLLVTGVRILQEYERGVVFRFGRARKLLATPGFNVLLPFGIDRMRVVDVRTRAIQISPQDVITHDNISISVDAVVYASIASPAHAVLEVEEYSPATLQLAATTLRSVIGKMELDDILAHRDAINDEVRTILDTRTEQWGVEISAVEIKDIQLPREMQRAMARQAEAERERRAKVIAAEGEVQAAAKLAQAAEM